MKNQSFRRAALLGLLVSSLVGSGWASTPIPPAAQKLMQEWSNEVRAQQPGFSGFSAAAGKQLYYAERTHSEGDSRSCATCHGQDPAQAGRNASTGKVIEALSPVVNAERFTKAKEINKWFRRNCKWVLERECTAQEKGDFLEYMHSL